MTNEPIPTRRHWFQFRLRTLLVAMLVVSLGMGWVMKQRRRIAERREGLKSARSNQTEDRIQPDWSLTVFGDNWPAFAKELFFGNDANDTMLTNLRGLIHLERLMVSSSHVTDAGLANIQGLTNLRMLGLGSQISDAGVAHLRGLMRLEILMLSSSQVTDAGLQNLQRLKELKSLYLTNTQITDAGLAYLQELSQLQLLDLNNTKVTDAGVAKLQAALPNCRISHMQYTKSPSHKFSSP
jgi:Leucine-rich repeat (LRR) protein